MVTHVFVFDGRLFLCCEVLIVSLPCAHAYLTQVTVPVDKTLSVYLMRVGAEWETEGEDRLRELNNLLQDTLSNQQVLCAYVRMYVCMYVRNMLCVHACVISETYVGIHAYCLLLSVCLHA